MKKGFTLIELIVVITMLGILATVAYLSLTDCKAKTKYKLDNKCVMKNIKEIKEDIRDCEFVLSRYECKQEAYKKYNCIKLINNNNDYE